jgi:transposase
MAYRYGDRTQRVLFPPSVEDYVSADDPVRAYDALVEALDFEGLGIPLDPHQVGNSEYDPKAMLKLLVYGYSYGIRSSRKLERALYHNVSFMWLTGGLKPDHKTIAEFRRSHKTALRNVLRQCARLCIEMDLMDGNTLFVDGSKVRANASINSSWTRERGLKQLEKIDERISAILSECESVDESEASGSSLVRMKQDLADRERRRAKVGGILEALDSEGKTSINVTDRECTKIHGRQGAHAGYNVQSVVDDKHGLIVSSDVTNENNDLHQFAKQMEHAHETLEKTCQTACADAGYSNVDELEKVEGQGVRVIVPSSRQASEKTPGPFDASAFSYHREQDTYTCPQGHVLTYSHTNEQKQHRIYRIGGSTCRNCPHHGECSRNPRGRTITRSLKAEVAEKLAAQYEHPDGQAVYQRRKEKVELPFGHIKHNLAVTGFLLRGLGGVNAEAAILSTCFNMARMIGILGVTALIAKLAR